LISEKESFISKEKHLRHDAGMLKTSTPSALPANDEDDFFSEPTWLGIAGHLGLSPRELDIARCIVAEQADRQIAKNLGISVHTVQTHLVHLYQKIGVQSRLGVLKRFIHVHRTLEADPLQEVNGLSD
jgi:DNA-binding CsgD family transcriptional regulator